MIRSRLSRTHHAPIPVSCPPSNGVQCAHMRLVINGEEDEDTNAELRGVKLFIKRGKKDFSAGILGHIKYLRDKHTGEERLGQSTWFFSMSSVLSSIIGLIQCFAESLSGRCR